MSELPGPEGEDEKTEAAKDKSEPKPGSGGGGSDYALKALAERLGRLLQVKHFIGD